ncbi:TlpA family protein disulfide reductase [Herpetosiphon giganteus]|uniref:TlpA family protein disulfide reductase n=1 Tax=Herpetosiphon giganteus TaxID=2029754 RepID=UPI0019575AC5|nr:hypothetical protein [Herpetosiphon giganteus]MBM7846355.1 hypothetical protein [Herpetosiphon giganteus]
MSGFWLVSYITMWVLLIGLSFVMMSIMRNMGTLYQRIEQKNVQPDTRISKYEINEQVEPLTVTTIQGVAFDLVAHVDQKTAIIIISTHCAPCRDLIKYLADNPDNDPLDLGVEKTIVISMSNNRALQDLLEEYSIDSKNLSFYCDTTDSLSRVWGIYSTPTIITVDATAKITNQHVGFSLPQVALPA